MDLLLNTYLERAVRLYPSKVALEFGSESVSYENLKVRVIQLAQHLSTLECVEGDIVAIDLPPSVNRIVAVLATIHAGFVCLPIDRRAPDKRKEQIIAIARPKVCISDKYLGGIEIQVSMDEVGKGGAISILENKNSLHSSVYVLFTSGTTGRPKGVEMGQETLANLVHWESESIGYTRDMRTAQMAAFSFDVFFQELFTTVACGGTLVLMEQETRMDPELLFDFLIDANITDLYLPTPALAPLATVGVRADTQPRLQRVICAGDHLIIEEQTKQWFRKMPRACLHNHYGPTETHVVTSSIYESPTLNWPRMASIGKALPHSLVVVCDEQLVEVSSGVHGEILIGGDCLAKRYVGQPLLTSEKFIFHPTYGRLYRTGDRGSVGESGEIHLQGRVDRQVKISGYRVELDEIEVALNQISLLDQCAVISEPYMKGGGQRIVAFLVFKGGVLEGKKQKEVLEDVKEVLKNLLPEYMIPSVFEFRKELPKTISGKMDRRQLRSSGGNSLEDKRIFQDPLFDLDEFIRSIWKRLLEVDQISGDDNFFELGGTSLLAMRLQAELTEGIGERVPIVQIYAHPTLKKLSSVIQKNSSDDCFGGKDDTDRKSSSSRVRGADQDEDVAVVGIGCRFPGAVSAAQFWSNLCEGKSSIVKVPSSDGKVHASATLENIDFFDADYFNYSPSEARQIDPQQRIFLECVVEAMEDAALPMEHERVGVFAGCGPSTYLVNNLRDEQGGDLVSSTSELALLLSTAQDFLTARAAYKLGFNGPALNIQAACATSLFAIHSACQAIKRGECSIAIAGAACVPVPQIENYEYEEGMVFSKDGDCRPFDSEAGGTVFGSGVGVVVLKRLHEAQEDGDDIYCVIKGSAVSNDGRRKSGIAAPSEVGQADAIREAIFNAGIPVESIGYVEGHGTATRIGDPIEVSALKRVFDQVEGHRCYLGSVKSNLGHLGWAAGMAGFIKTALILRNRIIPGTLNFKTANPELELESSPFVVNSELVKWKGDPESLRCAGVSAFGLGGHNAHIVISEFMEAQTAEEKTVAANCDDQNIPIVVVLSAQDELQLSRSALIYLDHLKIQEDVRMVDFGYTLGAGRRHLPYRKSFVVRNKWDCLLELEKLVEAKKSRGNVTQKSGRVAFVFPGQGSEYPGMGKELYSVYASFRQVIDYADSILKRDSDFSLIDYIVNEKDIPGSLFSLVQPSCFAFQVALGRLYSSVGIEPTALMGHSLGEFAAAHLAGVFDFDTGIEITRKRGALFDSLKIDGAMVSVFADEIEVRSLVCGGGESLDIAASNGPLSTVVAGEAQHIKRFCQRLKVKGFRFRVIPIQAAGHSRLVDPVLDEFQNFIGKVNLTPPKTLLISNLTGQPIHDEICHPSYWRRQLRETVMFSKGCKSLARAEIASVVELGPASTVSSLAGSVLSSDMVECISTMKLSSPSDESFLKVLGQLFVRNVPVDWSAVYSVYGAKRIHLPARPFRGESHWVESTLKSEEGGKKFAAREPSFYKVCWEEIKKFRRNIDDSNRILFLVQNRSAAQLPIQFPKEAARSSIVNEDELKMLSVDAYDDVVDLRPLLVPLIDSSLSANADSVMKQFRELCEHTQRTVTYLSEQALSGIRYHVVTRGARVVTGYDKGSGLRTSLLIGLLRVAAIEHRSLFIRHVDLDEDWDVQLVFKSLLESISVENSEPELAVRGLKIFVPRIVDDTQSEKKKVVYKNDGSYLITGGGGAIGSRIAEQMIMKGAGRVIICGRSSLDAEKRDWLKRMEGFVEYRQADIANPSEVNLLFDYLVSKGDRLHGVVHAAAVVDDGALYKLEWAQFERVIRPKALGAWNLHIELTNRKIEPDFCCFFSSASSMLGNFGQANYAAANSFVDALSDFRMSQGSTATSICWGPWRSLGLLSESPEVMRQLEAKGMGGLETNDALGAFEMLCASKVPVSGFLANDWGLFLAENGLVTNSIFQHLSEVGQEVVAEKGTERERLSELNRDQRKEAISKILDSYLDDIVGRKWTKIVNRESLKFSEIGIDSLSIVQLKNRIQEELEITIPIVTMISCDGIDDLVLAVDVLFSNSLPEFEMGDSRRRELSCQQTRWLALIGKGYGKRIVPVVFGAKWDPHKFRMALLKVVERHELLRCVFFENDCEIWKSDAIVPPVEIFSADYSHYTGSELREALRMEAESLKSQTHDPRLGPSWSVKVVRMREAEWVVLLALQHVEFDGTALTTFVEELRENYSSLLSGIETEVDGLVPYSEYITSQKEYVRSGIEIDRAFYSGMFSSLKEVSTLSRHPGFDVTRPLSSRLLTVKSEKGTWDLIGNFSRKEKISEFSVLFAAYSLLVSELLNSRDVVISIITSGRCESRFSRTIGPFTAPFPLRVTLGEGASCELPSQCNKLVQEINSRSRYPVSDLPFHNSCFQNFAEDSYFSDFGINFLNYKKPADHKDVSAKIVEILGEIDHPDLVNIDNTSLTRIPGLHLVANVVGGNLVFNFWYHDERFEPVEVARWGRRLEELLMGIVKIN